MTLRPIGENLLLRVMESPVADGPLVLRAPGRGGTREAVVRACGPRYRGDLAPGDVVFVRPWEGREVRVNRELLCVAPESALAAARNIPEA